MNTNSEIAQFFEPAIQNVGNVSRVNLSILDSRLTQGEVLQTINYNGAKVPAINVQILGLKEFVQANAGSNYSLPIASATVLGGIKVGSGLSIDAVTGVLSASGGGTGTVTSVAVGLGATLSSIFSVSGSPITTSGTITLAASSQSANLFYASPNGASGTPTFRAIVAADLPSLSGVYVPYTGATADVDLGTNDINAEGVKVTGVAGNGHLTMRWQSVDPISAGNHTTFFPDADGDFKWKIDGGYYANLITSHITSNRAWKLPDIAGINTIATIDGGQTFTSAIWQGTKIAVAYGGTNSNTALSNNRIMISSSGAIVEQSAITASRIIVSDSNGLPIAADTSTYPSLIELSYVKGVTSAIQTQLDAKLARLTITTVSTPSSHTWVLTNENSLLLLQGGSTGAQTLTIPNDSTINFPVGTTIYLAQDSAFQASLVAAGGVTLKSTGSWLKFAAQNSVVGITKTAANTWSIYGQLTP